MSFVFYDTETTGTDTSFDQILQFAAIKTDADLNILDRFNIRCRPLPYIVPAPGAMQVTGVSVAMLRDGGLPSHYEMMRQVRAKLLQWSPAVFIGYNSLNFDEHLLRQAFYKTLHPLYLTNTNRNCRTDALRIVRAASIFEPNAIAVPFDDEGKPVFKLDRLAPANGFNHFAAHDALADVEAMIHLCRLVMQRASVVWSNAMRFSQKAAVVDFVGEERIFCLSEYYFGSAYAWLVTPIGVSPDNNSEFVVYNLAFDPEELAALPDRELIAKLASAPKPLRRLRSNTGPTLNLVDDAPAIAAGLDLGTAELERRAEFLYDDKAFRSRLIACFQQTRPAKVASLHVESQIYDGFWRSSDDFLMEQFHNVPWEKRLAIATSLQDPRLRTIGLSLIHTERPDLLPVEVCAQHDMARACRMLGIPDGVPWLTLPRAITELDLMLAECAADQSAFLQGHRQHLVELLMENRTALALAATRQPVTA